MRSYPWWPGRSLSARFSEEWLPAGPPREDEALTLAPWGLGAGELLTAGTWSAQSTLVSWTREKKRKKKASVAKICWRLWGNWRRFSLKGLPSDHAAISCFRNQGSGVLCMFTLPGRSTITNRKSRSVSLASLALGVGHLGSWATGLPGEGQVSLGEAIWKSHCQLGKPPAKGQNKSKLITPMIFFLLLIWRA